MKVPSRFFIVLVLLVAGAAIRVDLLDRAVGSGGL